ncbi:MAG: hypothetical protein H6R18_2718 [Proteobacteria bacterium]|nr:hypothetical protein [Pseudomonadota bacterium]
MRKYPEIVSGHLFIELSIGVGVLALGVLYAAKGWALGILPLLLAGSLGVAVAVLTAVNMILQNIETGAIARRLMHFPFGIFSVVGILVTEIAIAVAHFTASKSALLLSPFIGIAAGLAMGALLARENTRLEAMDEKLSNGVEGLFILLFPAYIFGPIVLSVFAALFEDGFGEGIKNLVGLLTFLALLTGVTAVLYWLACHFPGWASFMRWSFRTFCFGLFVLVPVAGLTTLLYAALQGPVGWLETLVCSEILILTAAFVVWTIRKARREQQADRSD